MLDFIRTIWWKFKSHFVTQRIEYDVTGKCNQCGECCRNVYSIGTNSERDFAIMKFLYPSYRRFYIKGKDANGNLVFACKHIQEDGRCSVYQKRPMLCRNYPKKRIKFYAPMPDGCGYKVVKKNFKDYLD